MKKILFLGLSICAAVLAFSCRMASSTESESAHTGGRTRSGTGGGTPINYSADLGSNSTDAIRTLFSSLTGDSTIALTGDISTRDISTIKNRIHLCNYNINLDLSGVNNLTEIPDNAFTDCKKLTGITLPASVTTIGDSAFDGCKNLASITLPDSVTTIGDSAFDGCKNLASITLPDSVTTIGVSTFDGCKNLASITLPDSVTTIGDSAFDGCEKLTGITLPDSVTTIGDFAFCSCGLEQISIPATVTDLSQYAFDACVNLTSIDVSDLNLDYSSEDGVLYDKHKETLICFPGGKTGSYTIPESVRWICESALAYSGNLSELTIPASITADKFESPLDFSLCENLTSINVDSPNTDFSSIDGVLFNSNKTTLICYPMKKTGSSYEIPDSVTKIGFAAFSGCENLTEITIPDSVTTIENSAFQYCTGLQSIEIPGSVETIGYGAFEDCSNLTQISISASVECINYHVFDGCEKLETVTFLDPNNWYSSGSLGNWPNKNGGNPFVIGNSSDVIAELNGKYLYKVTQQ